MTARDRLVLAVVAALAVLGAVWVLLVSPERKTASKLSTEVGAASTQLANVQAEAANARLAQARYSSAYASVVNLGKAVPPRRSSANPRISRSPASSAWTPSSEQESFL